MSVESLAVVLHHSQASGTDKLVLIGIANHDGDGGAWPSVATLAKYANVSTRSVNNALAKLRQLGEVVSYIQGGGTRATPDHKRPNRYEILVKCPEGCDRTRNHRVTPVDKPVQEPLQPASPPAASFTPTPAASFTPTPAASFTRTSLINPPGNLALESTSWGEHTTCRACGKPKDRDGKWCSTCAATGLDTDIINCLYCPTATKRRYHGQTHFICPEHKHLGDPND